MGQACMLICTMQVIASLAQCRIVVQHTLSPLWTSYKLHF